MSVIDKTTLAVAKFSDLIYFRALRDGVGATVPFFFAASFAILLAYVICPLIIDSGALSVAQQIAEAIRQGSLSIMGLLIAPSVAFALAKHRGFDNPVSAALIAISVFFVFIPINQIISIHSLQEGLSNQITPFGTPSMLVGIVIGLLASDTYMMLVKRNITLKFGQNVPPQVGNSIVGLIPYAITLLLFSIISVILNVSIKLSLFQLFETWIQSPLQLINTSLWGYNIIYGFGSLLFSFGIHQTGINSVLLDPLLLLNINENINLLAEGKELNHIITNSFQIMYTQMGGSGGTLSLIIAIFIFSRYQPSRDVAKVSVMPGIFAINEPMIFGFPIVFNPVMIVPFVMVPLISTTVAYYATLYGFVSKTVVMVPWTTPPLISGYIATAGDFRAVVLQFVLIILGVFIYLPFMKYSEKIMRLQQG
ncbi:PTS sugar transporter subunit IIC [Thorsellia anophelis]|uniref:Permease IIC component n=1 Tax=Thorsellia anophelis DSM 18579 TaxID=1123402 RepID=A0A1I0DZH0_9GAMM|nr:PTS transporter subunit EIIC [Thorsellia anophelis]SET38003.1 PTS system, cellobiose-specific IIC component [Thorsellia anophelis DSM 18579]